MTENKHTGAPWWTPAEIGLTKLADEYVRRCDEFDANHGTMVGGFWRANGMYAQHLCLENEKVVERELWLKAAGLGFSACEWRHAKAGAERRKRNG